MGRTWIALALVVACNSGKSAKDDLIDQTPHDYQREVTAELASYGELLTRFRDDLAAGHLDAAYAQLAPMTRASVHREDLAALANHPAFATGVTYTITRSSTTSGLATLSGRLSGPSGPARLELHCTHVTDGWRISGIAIDGAAILPPR